MYVVIQYRRIRAKEVQKNIWPDTDIMFFAQYVTRNRLRKVDWCKTINNRVKTMVHSVCFVCPNFVKGSLLIFAVLYLFVWFFCFVWWRCVLVDYRRGMEQFYWALSCGGHQIFSLDTECPRNIPHGALMLATICDNKTSPCILLVRFGFGNNRLRTVEYE